MDEKAQRDHREKLLHTFLEAWNCHPDFRFGQIVSNLSQEIGLSTNPYYITDRDFLVKLEEMRKR